MAKRIFNQPLRAVFDKVKCIPFLHAGPKLAEKCLLISILPRFDITLSKVLQGAESPSYRFSHYDKEISMT